MRIDSHLHFWRYDTRDYAWMSPDMSVLKRDHLPDDARPLLDRMRIDAAVAVQARETEEETDFLLGLTAEHDWIAAVIGWADLADENLEQRLQRWIPSNRLAGFRHILQNDPGAGERVDSTAFRRGVRLLQDRSLIYELLISADQLPLVRKFCQVLDRYWLVLDHLGKPDILHRQLDAWIRNVEPLAALPHVVCKLSGLLTEANDSGGGFDESHVIEYLDSALALFGAQRLMIGSDWPVCTLVESYSGTLRVLESWSSRLSAADREQIWGGTAARIYGISEAT